MLGVGQGPTLQNSVNQGRAMSHSGNDHRQCEQGGCVYNEELVLSSTQEIGSPFQCHFYSSPIKDNAVKVN